MLRGLKNTILTPQAHHALCSHQVMINLFSLRPPTSHCILKQILFPTLYNLLNQHFCIYFYKTRSHYQKEYTIITIGKHNFSLLV